MQMPLATLLPLYRSQKDREEIPLSRPYHPRKSIFSFCISWSPHSHATLPRCTIETTGTGLHPQQDDGGQRLLRKTARWCPQCNPERLENARNHDRAVPRIEILSVPKVLRGRVPQHSAQYVLTFRKGVLGRGGGVGGLRKQSLLSGCF